MEPGNHENIEFSTVRMNSKLETVNEMLEVQGKDGNWNFDPYMHGMYNGMEFIVSILEDREPNYRNAPEQWISNDPSNHVCTMRPIVVE